MGTETPETHVRYSEMYSSNVNVNTNKKKGKINKEDNPPQNLELNEGRRRSEKKKKATHQARYLDHMQVDLAASWKGKSLKKRRRVLCLIKKKKKLRV